MFLKGKSPERISGIDNEIVSVLRFFFFFFFFFFVFHITMGLSDINLVKTLSRLLERM